MKRRALIPALCLVLPVLSVADQEAAKAPPDDERPLIQIALLLDTSGSMSGMINQARNQLWSIVNRFVDARRDGVRPRLQVALYHYGTPSLGKENGFVKQLCPLTEDLDAVSEKLFGLTTSGGDEYCGWVIRTAVNELQWSPAATDYKAIFIAGNESFGQGKVKYQTSCKKAISAGILVNTIHCSGGSNDQWEDGARLADGRYMHIDQDKAVVEIETPFDEELAKLGRELNKTYIAYGAEGAAKAERQLAVDAAAQSFGAANMAKRAAAKAGGFYKNKKWDLVDAAEEDDFDVAQVEKEQLPQEMREMDEQEQKAYIEEKRGQRKDLQTQIKELTRKREEFLQTKREELAEGNEETLGTQLEKAVVDQASKTGFSF